MSCSLGIPEIPFEEMQARFLRDQTRWPLAGSLELTERCNLRCVHCYVNQPAGDTVRRRQELRSEQWFGILDQLADAGCLKLLMTGGEVLLHPDFSEIYGYAKSKGFLIAVFTNGTLISPEIAQLFYEWPPQTLSITMYGASEAVYERMTGVAGSYSKFMRGLGYLSEYEVPFQLKTVLTTVNEHEYEDMKEFAKGLELGLKHDSVLWPRMDGTKEIRHLRLAPEKVVDFDLKNPESMCAWYAANKDSLAAPASESLYVCGAGVRSFHINAYGNLGLCLLARAGSYSLVEGSFEEGWNRYLPGLRHQPATKDLDCRHCEIARLCAYCPAFAQWENGDPESVVEYLCEIAHRRARRFSLLT